MDLRARRPVVTLHPFPRTMETTTFTDQSSRLASANPGGASVLAAPAGSLILALPAAAPEFILTGQVRPGEPLAAAWGRLADELAVRQAELLGLMIYAPVALQPQIKRVMRVILGKTDWPVTWVDADDCEGRPLPGMQAFAVSGRPVSRVRLGDMVVGSVYDDGAARFCLLGGLGPADASVTAPASGSWPRTRASPRRAERRRCRLECPWGRRCAVRLRL